MAEKIKKYKKIVIAIMAVTMLSGVVLNHFGVMQFDEFKIDVVQTVKAVGETCSDTNPCKTSGEECVSGTCQKTSSGAPVPTDPDYTAEQAVNEAFRTLQGWVNILLQFLSALLWPILLLIGALLKNDLLFGGEMGERLNWIWIQVRNLVNIVFVVILVGIALYNVLGFTEKENYKLQTILPKFAIALIAVNFSFLACKLVLDATNVATTAVFAIPYSQESSADYMATLEEKICVKNQKKLSIFCEEDTNGKVQFNDLGKKWFSRPTSDNMAVGLAVYLGKLSDMDFIKTDTVFEEGQSVTKLAIASVSQLTINMLFSVIMYLVFGFSFAALFIVLLARVVVLWLVIALSPLIAIKITLPDLMSGLGDELDLDKKFIQHAAAPIVIGFAFVIGYLMLDAYQGAGLGDLGSVNITSIGENTVISGISNLQSLMIALCAVAVVWLGTFAAASKTVASSLTESIKSAGQRMGTFIAKAPLYIPAFPIKVPGEEGKPEKRTAMSVLRTIPAFGTAIDRQYGKPLIGTRSPSDRLKGLSPGEAGRSLRNMLGSFEPQYYKSTARDLYNEHGKGDENLKKIMEKVADNNKQSFAEFIYQLKRTNKQFGKSFPETNVADIQKLIGAPPPAGGKPATPPSGTPPTAKNQAQQVDDKLNTAIAKELPASVAANTATRDAINNLTQQLRTNQKFQEEILKINGDTDYIKSVQELRNNSNDPAAQTKFKEFFTKKYGIDKNDNATLTNLTNIASTGS